MKKYNFFVASVVIGVLVSIFLLLLFEIKSEIKSTNSKLDEISVMLEGYLSELDLKVGDLHPQNPQFNIMHGFYGMAKDDNPQFRVIQVDEFGRIILSENKK